MAFTGQLGTANSRLGNLVLGFGSAAVPVEHGTGALTGSNGFLAGTATFTKPTYHGTGVLIGSHGFITATGTFTKPVYTGSGSLTGSNGFIAGQGERLFANIPSFRMLTTMYAGGW